MTNENNGKSKQGATEKVTWPYLGLKRSLQCGEQTVGRTGFTDVQSHRVLLLRRELHSDFNALRWKFSMALSLNLWGFFFLFFLISYFMLSMGIFVEQTPPPSLPLDLIARYAHQLLGFSASHKTDGDIEPGISTSHGSSTHSGWQSPRVLQTSGWDAPSTWVRVEPQDSHTLS